jgi:hypothetical protein
VNRQRTVDSRFRLRSVGREENLSSDGIDDVAHVIPLPDGDASATRAARLQRRKAAKRHCPDWLAR